MDGNISSLSYSPSPFQKPSTTDLVLNKVCDGGKWGRAPTLQKGAFLDTSSGFNVNIILASKQMT